jgi:hypothetical protein
MDINERCNEIRKNLPIRTVIEGWYGHELNERGRGTCPFCGGSNKTKFRIVDGKGYVCSSCEKKGDVITFITEKEQITGTEDVLSHIEARMGTDMSKPQKRRERSRRVVSPALEEQARYRYLNEAGDLAYEIVRYWNPESGKKEFKPFRNGKMGLSADNRILYNLNLVANSTDEVIYITEGEKACDAMSSLGYLSTCNPFGCSQWKDEFNYDKYLEGKSVVILPDHDDDGEHFVEMVMENLRGKIKEARILRFTKKWVKEHRQFKGHDIADYLEVEGPDATKEFITKAEKRADVWIRGFEVGITVSPSEAYYKKYLPMMDEGNFNVLDFSMWLPTLEVKARRGDLVNYLAGTKVGKSRLLMNTMYFINNVTYLLFDLELSVETVGERWCALHNGVSVDSVQHAHHMGKPYDMPDLSHIRIANCGSKDINFVRERIDAEEQIIGKPIDVIGIDYVGLMNGRGNGKTEVVSGVVEDFKGMLNDLRKTGLMSSQRLRPNDKEADIYKCPTLFDNKDSSAIENSAQLTIGYWKQQYNNMLAAQVLAYSHGNCNQDPIALTVNELKITERK